MQYGANGHTERTPLRDALPVHAPRVNGTSGHGNGPTEDPDLTIRSKPTTSWGRLGRYLDRNVDTAACGPISVFACFLTGFSSAISFTVSFLNTGQYLTIGMLCVAGVPDGKRRAACDCDGAHV